MYEYIRVMLTNEHLKTKLKKKWLAELQSSTKRTIYNMLKLLNNKNCASTMRRSIPHLKRHNFCLNSVRVCSLNRSVHILNSYTSIR